MARSTETEQVIERDIPKYVSCDYESSLCAQDYLKGKYARLMDAARAKYNDLRMIEEEARLVRECTRELGIYMKFIEQLIEVLLRGLREKLPSVHIGCTSAVWMQAGDKKTDCCSGTRSSGSQGLLKRKGYAFTTREKREGRINFTDGSTTTTCEKIFSVRLA